MPDRRIGSEGIAAALRSAGLPVASVEPAGVVPKGSRPFVGTTGDGQRLFIKALGLDQRDADLLYRAYRFARLRNVGDTWPAASVIRAAEHQALIAVMAEWAGVRVPRVDRVIKAGGATALLVMDRVEGSSLGQLAAQQISDDLLQRLWAEVRRLHRAGIAHRSLRAANVMIGGDGQPWLTDFSFSELAATQRQKDRRPRSHRGRPGRGPDRHRRAPRARGLGGSHLPASHLLAARPTRLGRLAAPAGARLRLVR